jgi:hypothetical protein
VLFSEGCYIRDYETKLERRIRNAAHPPLPPRDRIAAAELVFDAYSTFMRWVHNLRVIRKRVGSHLNWDLKNGQDLESWGSASPAGGGIRLLDERFPFQFPEADQRRTLRVRLFSPLVATGIGVFRYRV